MKENKKLTEDMTAEEVIELLGLVPLEGEGGMFRQTWFSSRKDGDVPYTQAIYYFLTANSFSHMHRLTSEEVYHFYMGDPVELCELKADGTTEIVVLGDSLRQGERPQYVVAEGSWQGSRVKPGGRWALMSTMMCPCFSPGCYEHGNASELKKQFPEAAEYIEALTGEITAY